MVIILVKISSLFKTDLSIGLKSVTNWKVKRPAIDWLLPKFRSFEAEIGEFKEAKLER